MLSLNPASGCARALISDLLIKLEANPIRDDSPAITHLSKKEIQEIMMNVVEVS